MFDLCVGQFAARLRSRAFLLDRQDSASGFRQRQLQLLQPRTALGAIFLDFAGQTRELDQLGFFFAQVPLDFCNRVVRLLDFSGVLFAFLFSVGDLAPRALDELSKVIRALSIELNSAAVRANFAFQSLHLRA